MPDSVVGVRCGGSNAEGHRTYEFSRTGEFMASRGSAGFSGVVVSGSQYMTFHVPGEPPFVSSWEVVRDPVLGPLLFLDGYSHLPGSCNSQAPDQGQPARQVDLGQDRPAGRDAVLDLPAVGEGVDEGQAAAVLHEGVDRVYGAGCAVTTRVPVMMFSGRWWATRFA